VAAGVATQKEVRIYKPRICQKCGCEYIQTGSSQRYCVLCIPKVEAAKCLEYYHRVGRTKRSPDAISRGTRIKRCVEYDVIHAEAERVRRAAVYAAHPEKFAERNAILRITCHERIRAIERKHSAKRRALGFDPLNEPFSGCAAHHIDRERVIYIPLELHKSVGHNVFTGYRMEEINSLAFQWLNATGPAMIADSGFLF